MIDRVNPSNNRDVIQVNLPYSTLDKFHIESSICSSCVFHVLIAVILRFISLDFFVPKDVFSIPLSTILLSFSINITALVGVGDWQMYPQITHGRFIRRIGSNNGMIPETSLLS